MIYPVVSPIVSKGKIYCIFIKAPAAEHEILSVVWKSIKQLKNCVKQCGYQYCTPKALRELNL